MLGSLLGFPWSRAMTKKETLRDSPPAPALPRGMGPSPSSPSIKGSLVLKFREPVQGLWPFRFPFLDFFFSASVSYRFVT